MMKLILFAASLRADSCNKKLIRCAAKSVADDKVIADLIDFADIATMNYHADYQNAEGFPKEITTFVERLQAADGLIISSPEYNFSMPGTLKNVVDWVSRLNPMPWNQYPILLLSASPSLVGGNRSLWALRIPLEGCGAFVFPNMFSLASAYSAFDEQGALMNQDMQQRLGQTIKDFITYVRTIKQLTKS